MLSYDQHLRQLVRMDDSRLCAAVDPRRCFQSHEGSAVKLKIEKGSANSWIQGNRSVHLLVWSGDEAAGLSLTTTIAFRCAGTETNYPTSCNGIASMKISTSLTSDCAGRHRPHPIGKSVLMAAWRPCGSLQAFFRAPPSRFQSFRKFLQIYFSMPLL